MVRDLDLAGSSQATDAPLMLALPPYLLFAADDGTSGEELWRTDGSWGGTVRLTDFTAPALFLKEGCVLGSRAFFAAPAVPYTPFFVGNELMVTDGTAAGTSLLMDVYPGRNDSFPHQLTAGPDRVYFSAADTRGFELWAVNLFFADGLESGDTGLWSGVSP